MKILIITDKLYPDEIGGSCTYAYETSKEFHNMGHEVTIFTCYPEKKDNNKFLHGINIYRNFNKRNLLYSAKQLSKLLQKQNFDKVIFHSPLSYFVWYLSRVKVQKNSDLIGIYHGPWYREAYLKYKSRNKYFSLVLIPLMKMIEKLYAKDVMNFIFLSEYMKKELEIIYPGIAMDSLVNIIPGGVKLRDYERKYTKDQARELLNIDKNAFLIFSLRRLEYRMGIQNAISSLKDIELPENQKVLYIIGGKGPYEQSLKSLASGLKVNCRFEGFIAEDRINAYFCAADLFLVPSIDLEGFGLVILESLAMGLPVVTTPQGGMIDVAKNFENLFLAEGLDDISIAKKISEISVYVKSKEYHIEKNISDFDWSLITRELNKVIIGE